MGRDRAYRRRQLKKRKKIIRDRMLTCWGYTEEQATDRQIGRMVRMRGYCSCGMCGNPRKYDGELTIQERKFLDE